MGFTFFEGPRGCSNALQPMPADASYKGVVFNASSLTPEEQYAIDLNDGLILMFQVTCKLFLLFRLKRHLNQVLDDSTAFNGQAPWWFI